MHLLAATKGIAGPIASDLSALHNTSSNPQAELTTNGPENGAILHRGIVKIINTNHAGGICRVAILTGHVPGHALSKIGKIKIK